MPRKTIKYLCNFKCGTKATDYKTMLIHEENCFLNPKNKACRLCENLFVDEHYLYCNILKLQYTDGEVINDDGVKIWPENTDNLSDLERFFKGKTQKPFPTKNCNHFKLALNKLY